MWGLGRRRLYQSVFVAVCVATALWLVLRFLFPTPPSIIPFAVGFPGGTYELHFQPYKEILARQHVTLEFRRSGGAVENMTLLEDPKTGIQAAFIQGGIKNSKQAPGFLSLGRIAYQPFYVFYRANETLDDLTQLKGKRIALGAAGNGSKVVAEKILALSGITAENSTFLPQFAQAAIDALIDGRADVVFQAFANEALTKSALRDRRIRLMSLTRADALTRMFPFLEKIVLPQGVIDFENNVPPSDVTLISVTTGVLVRDDMHPAIVSLLAEALLKTHSGAGLFHRAGEFPTQTDPEFPMAPAARDYYRNGPSLLNQYVPFWITNSAQKIIAVLVAVFGVILPLARYVPHARDWYVRRRFQAWYGELQALEASAGLNPNDARLNEIRAALTRIEDSVCTARLPSNFTAQSYSLREHIELVRRKLSGVLPA